MWFCCEQTNLDHNYMLELNTPTEPTIENLTEGQENSTILDLSKKGLKKVPKPDDVQHVKELILDENSLQKIDNIDSFLKVEKVHTINMWCVCACYYTHYAKHIHTQTHAYRLGGRSRQMYIFLILFRLSFLHAKTHTHTYSQPKC